MDNNINESEQSGPLRIDLRGILKKRFPKFPAPLARRLEKIVRQKELNEILAACFPRQGSAFAAAALKYLGVKAGISGEENIPAGGRFIFASNHPLGGLDGIALIDFLGHRYGDDHVKFLVNDMLMNVRPLRNVFLPINKFGAQGRSAAREINATYASDSQMLIFPAGLVSRLGADGRIRDLEWQKAFVAKALEYDRDIIPVYFDGRNSMRFYRTARWRKRLGIRFNIEQALLPSELCRAKGERYNIVIGKPITVAELRDSGLKPSEIAARIRREVYLLGGDTKA